jgi:hypothetical protein
MVLRRSLMLGSLLAPVASLASGADAATLLARAKQRYFGLKTYQDEGSVRYPLLFSDQEVTFKTAFVRPGLFRFEWSSGHPFPPLRFLVTRSVIVSDGQRIYTWTKYPGKSAAERNERSLADAVAGATGVSSRAAHVIATMLMEDLWGDEPFGDSILNVSSPAYIGRENVEEVMCDRIRGADWRGDAVDLWLGAEDSLVRRTERQARARHIEVRNRIIVNANIERSRFSAPSTSP